MVQAHFWDDIPDPPPPVRSLPLAPGAVARDWGLRWYQREAKEAVEKSLGSVRSTLAVMATGLGKTQLFSAIAGDWPGDVLVLAHRDELVRQAAKRLEQMTGEMVEVEKATEQASGQARLVVGSVQSVCRPGRLARLGLGRFGLVIVDEAHHSTAATYRTILEHFASSKVLGVTATPDRSDEKALGQVFDEVAYCFDIAEGIEQGYLVPLKGRRVEVEEIDLSGVKVQSGDLVAGQLDEAMLKGISGIVDQTIKLAPERSGVAFFPGIKSAQMAAELFNQRRPGSAVFVHGGTPEDQRRMMTADVRAGRVRYFCNVGIATEGFDWPEANLIVQGRPTKSRALYAQICGRGTRVLPGLVEDIDGKERGGERRGRIAGSGKPDCMILDFVGNSGRHNLVTPTDLLGGSYSEAEVELAKKKAKGQGAVDPKAMLEAARAELQQIAAKLRMKTKATVREFSPFDVFHMDNPDESPTAQRFGYKPATEKQRAVLTKMGVPDATLRGLSVQAATKLIGTAFARRDQGLATMKQLHALQQAGINRTDVTFQQASAVLDIIFAAKRSGSRADVGRIGQILDRRRQPGEEG